MPKKVEQYKEERQDVFNKILKILNIDLVNNNMFSLHRIDENPEIQNKIYELEPEIKKYFIHSNWTCYKQKNEIKRRWLSLLKYLAKDLDYKLIPMQLKSNINKPKYEDTFYSIFAKI
jgi:hypothetical protein